MKENLLYTILVFCAIVHVHLNMFTVENYINPSFWVYLIFEGVPFVGGTFWQTTSDIIVMGIHCSTTALVAYIIISEDDIKKWFVSFTICIPLYFLLQSVINIPNDSIVSRWYYGLYYYNAFPSILRFSVIQLSYIVFYRCMKKCYGNVEFDTKHSSSEKSNQ